MNELRRLKRDVCFFAEQVLGVPLWPHQREVVRSRARHRVVCSGRQAGKSMTLAVLALHAAFSKAGAFVLVVSAGEQAAKDLLATCSLLAANPLFAGSVVDDNRTELLLSNGPRIRSVPQSQRQVRGASVDLLIIDEACWVEDAIWTAAKFSTVARKDSRIVMASTPWGRQDKFFAVAYRAGCAGTKGYESFHWPSTVSPLVDGSLIDEWRATDPDRVFRAEVLAEWIDDQGAYFSVDELEAATRDFALVSPGLARSVGCVAGIGGVDWGFQADASTCVVVAGVGARGEEFGVAADALFVPFVEEGFRVPYAAWVDRVVEVARGFGLRKVVSEMNGVGAMPSQELSGRLGSHKVVGVHTDGRLKEDAFARVKVLLQQQRLVVPRHPQLLMQLSALEYEQSDSGVLKISVPERAGHDDLAMALCLAVHGDPKFGVVRRSSEWSFAALDPLRRQVRSPSPSARSVRSSDRPTLTFNDGRRVALPRGSVQERILRQQFPGMGR